MRHLTGNLFALVGLVLVPVGWIAAAGLSLLSWYVAIRYILNGQVGIGLSVAFFGPIFLAGTVEVVLGGIGAFCLMLGERLKESAPSR